MTGAHANGGHGGSNRRPAVADAARNGFSLTAQLRGPTQLTSCDGIPWTIERERAARHAQIALWIVVGVAAREHRAGKDVATDEGDPRL